MRLEGLLHKETQVARVRVLLQILALVVAEVTAEQDQTELARRVVMAVREPQTASRILLSPTRLAGVVVLTLAVLLELAVRVLATALTAVLRRQVRHRLIAVAVVVGPVAPVLHLVRVEMAVAAS